MGETQLSIKQKKPEVYYLQNVTIHKAIGELVARGVFEAAGSLDRVREMAGVINRAILSISQLSLKQREVLINQLRELGATVRNPHLYASDVRAESGKKERKIVVFSEPKEEQLRMLDALAGRICWAEPDGYLRFCHKMLQAPRPRNSKEVTKLRLAMESIVRQQEGSKTGAA
jgi:hypothetical protein